MPTLRHLLAIIVAVCALACIPATALAQLPWPKVAYGMSPTEVSRLVPGASQVESHDTGSRRTLVKLDGFAYAGRTFNVDFIFESGALAQVHLGDTVFMQENQATTKSFETLVAALRKTYGQESYNKVEPAAWGLSGEAKWQKDDAEVVLTISPVTQQHSSILFNFFKRK